MSRPRVAAAEFARRAGPARLPRAEVGAVVRLMARLPRVLAVAGAAVVLAAALLAAV